MPAQLLPYLLNPPIVPIVSIWKPPLTAYPNLYRNDMHDRGRNVQRTYSQGNENTFIRFLPVLFSAGKDRGWQWAADSAQSLWGGTFLHTLHSEVHWCKSFNVLYSCSSQRKQVVFSPFCILRSIYKGLSREIAG